MRQDAFEAQYGPIWARAEDWIKRLSSGPTAFLDRAEADRIGREFPALYRQVCQHLAIARARRYSFGLQQRLNRLALDGHRHLYRPRSALLSAIVKFAARDFPAAFRRFRAYMLVAAAMFVLPGIGMGVAVQLDETLVYSLLDPSTVSQMESMYDPANREVGRERQSATDVAMFGVYIYNNISIGFRTFAGGLVFGLGSAFVLLFNGVVIGAVASHLTSAGYTSTFWPFVVGHSSLELTAIVIFGGIGLYIGMAALAPGNKRRWHAIRDRASDSLPLIYGGTAMLVAAAFVEAFWSSTTWPPLAVKYAVGGLLWLGVIAYFTLAGRRR